MNNREKIDEIIDEIIDEQIELWMSSLSSHEMCRTDAKRAIYAALDAALGAEPSEGMEKAGVMHDFMDEESDIAADVIGIYRAMTAALRSELKVKP